VTRILLVLVLSCCSIASARAQDAAGSPGRASYDAGVTALEAGDSELALERFREAARLDQRADFVLALAATLQERSGLTEAIGLYTRLLASEFGELQESQRSGVEAAVESARSQLAVLTVTVSDIERVRVELDGREVGAVGPSAALTLSIDPGEHELAGSADGRRASRVRIRVAAREGRSHELVLPLLVTLPDPVVVDDSQADPGHLDSTAPIDTDDGAGAAWPWVLGVGGGALLVAVIVIIAVVASGGSGSEYSVDPIPAVTALTRR
jgi:hypothetical protein